MKIFFDTNVLISTFLSFKKGHMCYDVIDHAVETHQLYYSSFILDEFRNVLQKNFNYPEALISDYTAFITRFLSKGQTAKTAEKVCRDPKDDQVLADAVNNAIDIIVTGDKDLLVLKNYKGIKILNPKDYWKL